MPIYNKPTWELMRDCMSEMKKEIFTVKEIISWFRKNYCQIKENTVYLHVRKMTTNLPSRVNWTIVPIKDDFFFQLPNGYLRLYDKAVDPTPIYERSNKTVTIPEKSTTVNSKRPVIKRSRSKYDVQPVFTTDLSRNKQAVVEDMIKYAPPNELGKATKQELTSWGLTEEQSNFLHNNHNAILLGAVYDYLVPYERAWRAPYELNERLGHLVVCKIATMTEEDILPFIKSGDFGYSLHRFPSVIAKRTINACKLLTYKYSGNARNIWPSGSPADLVVHRLEEFDGIGQKISHMMAKLLVSHFGVPLTCWEKIDVAVDRHVERVFMRTGLISGHYEDDGNKSVRRAVIETARLLCPQYPGSLDEPAFKVGLNWCKADAPKCSQFDQRCPLYNSCRKNIA